jgi:hypothetical protein
MNMNQNLSARTSFLKTNPLIAQHWYGIIRQNTKKKDGEKVPRIIKIGKDGKPYELVYAW